MLGPPDIEREVGLTGGHIFQGECLPPYMWDQRLAAAHADARRLPLRGLHPPRRQRHRDQRAQRRHGDFGRRIKLTACAWRAVLATREKRGIGSDAFCTIRIERREETRPMARRFVRTAFHKQLKTLFELGAVGDIPDGDLLGRFTTTRNAQAQAAFTVLVERHGAMVLRVCRQILGNSHDAEDVFQATFLVLALRAGSVRRVDSVASWLHGVAHRVATRARSDADRRKRYERRFAASRYTRLGGEVGEPESWAELHEEISRLPRHYRVPVILCYLEGLTTEEAAQRSVAPRVRSYHDYLGRGND